MLIREGRMIRWWGGRRAVYVEFVPLSGRFKLGLEVDPAGDHDLEFTLCIVLFSLYVGFGGGLAQRIRKRLIKDYEPRAVSLHIFDWAIWWDVWHTTMSWKSGTPRWRNGCFRPIDFALGRQKHSEREVSRTESVIPMPEGTYPCTVVMKEETWRRPRLPWFPRRMLRAHIECPNGVPVPGKGENSWDCGNDAIFGTCCPAKTVEEGIASLVESALRDRRRYGGSVNWRQEKAAA
jgi:hypothetical protein